MRIYGRHICGGEEEQLGLVPRRPGRLVPINNLGEWRRYAGCRSVKYFDASTLTISQQGSLRKKFDACSGSRIPLPTGLKLEQFDAHQPGGDWLFRELCGA